VFYLKKAFFAILFISLIITSVFIVDLKKDNQTLILRINEQQNEFENLQKLTDELMKKNEDLTQEKEKIENEKQDILNSVNKKLLAMRSDSQIGNLKPSRSGIVPQFTLVSRGGFDLFSRQETLKDIAEGSYQHQKEEVKVDVDDLNSWQPLGTWKISHYTATVGECDRNPTITKSGQLVTPGFTIAVDHDFWPMGTIFYSKDLGFVIAADTGPSIKGQNRADYLTNSKKTPIPEETDMFLVYKPK
jgi:3D (Asp-Asp-Asp) domain-containing protein